MGFRTLRLNQLRPARRNVFNRVRQPRLRGAQHHQSRCFRRRRRSQIFPGVGLESLQAGRAAKIVILPLICKDILRRGRIYIHPADWIPFECLRWKGWVGRHESTVIQESPRLYKLRSPQSPPMLDENFLPSGEHGWRTALLPLWFDGRCFILDANANKGF